MADFSPTAQAVFDAIAERTVRPLTIAPVVAHALRAAAHSVDFDPWLAEHCDFRDALLHIATELENFNG